MDGPISHYVQAGPAPLLVSILGSEFELREVQFAFRLEDVLLVSWDELACNLHDSSDLILHLSHLDLLAHVLDFRLHASLECRDLVADFRFLGLVGVRVLKLCLEFLDAGLSMLAIVRDGSGLASTFVSRDFSLQICLEAFDHVSVTFRDIVL